MESDVSAIAMEALVCRGVSARRAELRGIHGLGVLEAVFSTTVIIALEKRLIFLSLLARSSLCRFCACRGAQP